MFGEGLKTEFSAYYTICWKESFDPIKNFYPLALFPPVDTSWLSRRMLGDLSVGVYKLTTGTESIPANKIVIRRSSLAGAMAATSICYQSLFFTVLLPSWRTCQWRSIIWKSVFSFPGVIGCIGVNWWRNGIASDNHDIACTGRTKIELKNSRPIRTFTNEKNCVDDTLLMLKKDICFLTYLNC